MRFCILYHPKLKSLAEKVDELCIRYNPKDTSLVEFMNRYPKKRFILWVDKLEKWELTKFVQIKEAVPEIDFTVKFAYGDGAEAAFTQAKEAGIPAFFDLLVKDWDTLNGLLDMGVSDMYITENLGFELDLVAQKAHSRGAKLRTFPNICQSSWSGTDPLKTFFIRPEDAEVYSEYIDCYEFFVEKDKQNINVLYKVYAKDKKWFGDLQEIILGFNRPLDSRGLFGTFAEKRIKCGKKCMKGKSGCQLCDRYAELAQTMNEHALYFKV